MKRLRSTILLYVLSFNLFSTAAEKLCDVGEFKSKDVGALSEVQQLSYLSVMSHEQYDEEKKGGSASGSYGIIRGSGSYQDFRQKVDKLLTVLKIDSFKEYKRSWAQSALDSNGLAAYRECLKAKGGFYVTIEALDETTSKLLVEWIPGSFGAMKSAPKVTSSTNIENVDEVSQQLGASPWKSEEHHLEITIKRKDATKAAVLTIKADNESIVTYLPRPIVVVGRRDLKLRETWTETATIIHAVPAESLGGTISLDITANAYSGSTGEVWIEVYTNSASENKQQKCSSPHISGSYNISTNYSCDLSIPYDAQSIEILSRNTMADAKSVYAKVSY